jgi:cytochrome c55X
MAFPESAGRDRRRPARRARQWIAGVLLLVATYALGADSGSASGAAPDAPRQRELIRLLRQDCGSCHGMRLTGGLGPPLTQAALHDRPVESLTATILDGRPGTAMPPWRPFMSEAEAQWLAARMREGGVHAR